MAHNAGPRRARAGQRVVPERQPVRADRRRRARLVAHAAHANAGDGRCGAGARARELLLGARRARGTASGTRRERCRRQSAGRVARAERGAAQTRRAHWPAARHAAHRHRRGAVPLRVARKGVAGLRRCGVAHARSRRRDGNRRRLHLGGLARRPSPERPSLRHGVRGLGRGGAAAWRPRHAAPPATSRPP